MYPGYMANCQPVNKVAAWTLDFHWICCWNLGFKR